MENLTMSSLDRLPASLEMLKWVGETAWVLGRPCWLEWNRNNWLESEINRMALELLLDLLVSTSEKKTARTAWQWLQELNFEAFKLFQGISVCMVCVQSVSLCVLGVSAPLIWWNPSCPSWAIAVCLIAVPLHTQGKSLPTPTIHCTNAIAVCLNSQSMRKWHSRQMSSRVHPLPTRHRFFFLRVTVSDIVIGIIIC